MAAGGRAGQVGIEGGHHEDRLPHVCWTSRSNSSTGGPGCSSKDELIRRYCCSLSPKGHIIDTLRVWRLLSRILQTTGCGIYTTLFAAANLVSVYTDSHGKDSLCMLEELAPLCAAAAPCCLLLLTVSRQDREERQGCDRIQLVATVPWPR